MNEEENTKRSLFINPLEDYNESRQEVIDSGAQFVDKVVTGGLEKINMPGAEFIGDRARNISGFTADMMIPEDWEIPIMGAAMMADGPLPIGDALAGLKYGQGVGSRIYRAGVKAAKTGQLDTIAKGVYNAKGLLDDVFSKGNSLFNRGQPGWRLATANGADVGQELAEQSAQPMRMTGSGGGNIGFSHVPANPTEIYKVNQKLLNSSLLGPNQKFNYAAYKALLDSDRGRTIAILFQTTPHAKIPNWATHRNNLVDIFEGTYGDVMKKLNISRSDIDIDHLFTLQQSMPIYDNVKFGSDLWNDLQRTMLNRKYQPGNTLANLNALDPGTHQVKTAFFNALHGKNGSKFFTKKRMKLIQNDPVKRMELLNKYLDETDKAREILTNGQTVWRTLYGKETIMPEELVEALANIPINKYSHPTLKGIIKEIVEDEAARYATRVRKGEEALIRAIKTGETPRVTKKNILPTQKQIDKAIKDAGTSYQPTLDPGNPDLL